MSNSQISLAEKTISYSLDDESAILTLAKTIHAIPMSSEGPCVVNVGGPSAVGKSTLAAKLADVLQKADVLAVDDYLSEGLWDQTRVFSHDPLDKNEPPYISGICPDIWDLKRLERDMSRLQDGLVIDRPIFDEQIKDRVGYALLTPRQYLILEGGHAFSPPFIKNAAHSVYVRAPLHDRLMRKIVRSTKIYGLDEVDEVLSRYVERDEMSNQYYDPIFCRAASSVVETITKPHKDYDSVAVDILAPGKRRALTPLESTGALHAEEELSVISKGNKLHIAYTVDSRLLVCRRISSTTLRLMQSCYELET